MTLDWRVISIGALDAHELRGETHPVRTGHATTTLITSGDARIIVDPGLPSQILAARLAERAGIQPGDVTHVFLTSFRPDVRRGIDLFENTQWLISEREREAVGVPMVNSLQQAEERSDDAEVRETLELDIAILQKCAPAPDSIAENVDLFPLPGVSPGMTGLLIAAPRFTVLLTGDAIPTVEHLESGKVPKFAADVSAARESFTEAVEIADMHALGRDNLVANPTKRPF
mgnify:CR=1 FL=1